MLNIKSNNSKEKINLKVIKGSIFSIIISLCLLLIAAILFTYTEISEGIIPITIIIISSISVFIGSIISTAKGSKGLISGGSIGAIYIILIYLISSFIISDFSINIKSIIMMIMSVIFGMIGGIVGVNINKK